jgi:hypothetical protein
MSASASSAAPRLHRPRWLTVVEGVQRPNSLMLLWGLGVGLLVALALLAVVPHYWPLIESRSTGMRASLAVLNEGGPLLVGRHGPHGAYYPIALGDDPGSFTYFPLLGHLLGNTDPLVVLSDFYVVVVAALTAAYPLIFYRLTRSLLAGLAAPVVLAVCIVSMGFIDIYWIPAWGMLALLPLLYLLAQRWPRYGLVALIAMALAAGWLSSIRNDAGLGIVLSVAIVLVLRRWRWWRVLTALVLVAAAYMATSSFIFTAIREHRDQRLGVSQMTDDEMTHHPLFHTAYIGLGYLHNDYGIRFKDEVSSVKVQKEDPGTTYLSHRYETIIRRVYFDYVTAHPLEALRQYGAKLLVSIADTGPYALLVLLTMPAMLLLGTGRRLRRLWVLLTIPALVVGLVQPMVAIPGQGYDTELLGVLGVLGILGICWMLAQVEGLARERGGLSFTFAELRSVWARTSVTASPLARSIRISAAAITVLALICTGGYFVRQSALRWQGTNPDALLRDLG